VYFKKKGILDHKVTLTEFYCNLLDQPGEILRFDSEVPLDGLQPDAICDYRYKLNVFQFCIEVHLSPVKFNFEKYDNFLNSGKWKEYFKSFPRVVIVTDKNIKVEHDKIKFFIVSTKGTGIEKIFRL
jgi:hypothetical protein